MKTLFIITGKPATGKSTVSNHLTLNSFPEYRAETDFVNFKNKIIDGFNVAIVSNRPLKKEIAFARKYDYKIITIECKSCVS